MLQLLRPSATGELFDDYVTVWGIINNTVWDLEEPREISKSKPSIHTLTNTALFLYMTARTRCWRCRTTVTHGPWARGTYVLAGKMHLKMSLATGNAPGSCWQHNQDLDLQWKKELQDESERNTTGELIK